MTGRTWHALIVWIVVLTASSIWHVFPAARSALDAIAVIAILILGLPHGALDLIDLRVNSGAQHSLNTVLFVYIALLVIAAMLWFFEPRIALLTFLAVAIGHFATEWRPDLPSPANWSAAALTVAAPAAAHPEEVSQLFYALSADRAWSDMLTWSAVTTTPFLIAALLILVTAKRSYPAEIIMIIGLGVAFLLLPPLTSFAIFFVVVHSPRHIKVEIDINGWSMATFCRKAAPMTLLASLLFLSTAYAMRDAQFGAAAFLLLAVLTIPHIFSRYVLRQIRF